MQNQKKMFELQNKILVAGFEERINTSFRNGIKAMITIDNSELNNSQKYIIIARLIFRDYETPEFQERFLSNIAEYLCCANKFLIPEESRGKHHKKTFDWEKDWSLLVAGFSGQYGIDLTDPNTKMHWHKFLALFKGLHECRLTEIMGIRSIDIGEIKDKDQRRRYEKMQKEVSLEIDDGDEEPDIERIISARQAKKQLETFGVKL